MSWNIYLGTSQDLTDGTNEYISYWYSLFASIHYTDTDLINTPNFYMTFVNNSESIQCELLKIESSSTPFVVNLTYVPAFTIDINKYYEINFTGEVAGEAVDLYTSMKNKSFIKDGKTYYFKTYAKQNINFNWIFDIFIFIYKIVDNLTGLDIYNKVFHCLEVKPGFVDEGKVFTYWTGRKRKISNRRLKFDIEFYPFTTRGDYTGATGFQKYYDLMDILHSNDFYLIGVDSEFERLNNRLTFPIKVLCPSVSELSSNKEGNNTKLTISLEEEWRY